MTFSNKVGIPDSLIPDWVSWVSDDSGCSIELCDKASRLGFTSRVTTWVTVRVRAFTLSDMNCAKDGSAAFVVREVMDLEEQYGTDYGGQKLRDRIAAFFDILAPRATFERLNMYKNRKKAGMV